MICQCEKLFVGSILVNFFFFLGVFTFYKSCPNEFQFAEIVPLVDINKLGKNNDH